MSELPVKYITENQLKKIFGERFSIAEVRKNVRQLKLLKQFLYTIGFVRKQVFEFKLAPKQGVLVDGKIDMSPRIVGVERTDQEWLSTSFASMEARLWSDDGSMRHQLRLLQRQGDR